MNNRQNHCSYGTYVLMQGSRQSKYTNGKLQIFLSPTKKIKWMIGWRKESPLLARMVRGGLFEKMTFELRIEWWEKPPHEKWEKTWCKLRDQ